jgi:hypothetical protein
MASPLDYPFEKPPSRNLVIVRLCILLLPTVLLAGASLRSEGQAQTMLWVGTMIELLILAFLVVARRAWQQPVGHAVTLLYLIALAWLWLSRGLATEWYSHLAQFLLFVIPLIVFAIQTLTDSGAFASRRANLLAQRLAQRKDWPLELADCRTLPEVKAFREALAYDATPALNLLQDPRPQVRLAALAALEFRTGWRKKQAELVLRYAQQAREPLLRSAAVLALANIHDRPFIERLAEALKDRAREVRRAAIEALLWDSGTRWTWIRELVHESFSDAAFSGDGPIVCDGPPLSAEVVADMIAWAAEKGPIAVRAAQTLGAYYQRVLTTASDSALLQSLKAQVLSAQTAPPLRIEVAHALRSIGALDRSMQEVLLEQGNPAPLRLIAAEEILGEGPHEPAVAALRDIARMPNREMALTTADVIQRRLGVDLGLALGQPLPAVHTRQAADVMRRLMKWAEVTAPDSQENALDTKLDPPAVKKRTGPFGLPPGLR